ncbi:hypothetical protein EEL30_15465 [Brevibacillus laterosporus]|uniref:Lipoprotein n=1 Tax=Brevibacillus laterosporus TaxID=1465 RepID=A0A518V9C7_BRELA|nr:hypothetical protein EEL30_15465 [Brevibacillus laterosporus]
MEKFAYAVILALLLAGCSSEQTSKSLSVEEQLALQYVEQFQNSKDVEVKKKFVEEHIYTDAKPIFTLVASTPSKDSVALNDVSIVGSVDYEKDGEKGKSVLVRGKKSNGEDVEEIFLFSDGKLVWGYTEADDKATFDKLRMEFK